jgi:uncharacterized membrane protein YfcA
MNVSPSNNLIVYYHISLQYGLNKSYLLMMFEYILIFIFQVMFNIFKVLEIKYTYENKLTSLLINSVWINLVSLTSVYYSVDLLLGGDLVVVPFYIVGSVFGKWVAIKKVDNIRNKVFSFIFGGGRKT